MFEMFRFEKVQQQQEEEYGKLCLQVADDHFPDFDFDFEFPLLASTLQRGK